MDDLAVLRPAAGPARLSQRVERVPLRRGTLIPTSPRHGITSPATA